MNYYPISQRRNEGTLRSGSDPENNVKGSRSKLSSFDLIDLEVIFK